MANEAIPYFDPADVTTGYCEAAVTGKRFVALSGPRVDGLAQISPAGAGLDAYGVAMRDAAATAKVGIAHVGVWPVVADGAITAGDKIAVGAAGKAKVAVAGQAVVGTALDDTADGADCPVRLSVATGGGSVAELDAVVSAEQVQDIVAAMIVAGAGMTATYDDAAGTLTLTSP